MINDQVHIPPGQEFKTCAFGKDHADSPFGTAVHEKGKKEFFALQVDIPSGKDPFIQIVVKSPDRHIKFRMVGNDLIM